MARNKIENPFFTEGMTIEEIMQLGDDTLRKLEERDISRAVRTLSLAANKRFNRLLSRAEVITNAEGKVDKFVERADKRGKAYGLDFNALQGYTSYIESTSSGKVKPFGVTNVKVEKGDPGYVGALKAEFTRVRNFLQAPSTTVEGATDLRKQKELELFGQTREQKIQQMLDEGSSAEDIKNMLNARNDFMSDVYEIYHKWREIYATMGTYEKEEGKKMLREIGRMMDYGRSGEETLANMTNYYQTLGNQEAAREAAKEEARQNRLKGR